MSIATTIRERPILFSGEMVLAILAGRKTVTRRLVKMPDTPARFEHGHINRWGCDPSERIACPFGQVGTRLWVREAFDIIDDPAAYEPGGRPPKIAELGGIIYDAGPWRKRGPNGERWVVDYKADGPHARIMDKAGARRWKPSIFMPRWASRITLEIESVRVERLAEITERDAIAEGVMERRTYGRAPEAIEKFAALWDCLNGRKPGCAWSDSPWVWVLEFKMIEPTEPKP